MGAVASCSLEEKCKGILLELGFPAHFSGYKQLKVAIPKFAGDIQQSLVSELYPYVAEALDYSDGRAVERSVRRAIIYVWENGDKKAWDKYFPGLTEVPTNKRFIATISEYITK